jgi:CBS domain-containing protein
MQGQIKDVMTERVYSVLHSTCLRDVASLMKDQDIGDVLVVNDDGTLRGIVTDRDLVVRGIACGCDIGSTCAGDIATENVFKLAPDATIDEAVRLMRDNAVRRVPVMNDGVAIGIVSLGDLARVKDPQTALGHISQAAPQH